MQYDRMHPEAVTEMVAAAETYELADSGLGTEFLTEVRVAIDRILKDPETGFLTDEGGIRMIGTRRFPYIVLFDYTKTPPFILAIYHQRRDPDAWKSRITKRSN